MKVEKLIGRTVLNDQYDTEWKVITATEDGELVKLQKKCGSVVWITPDELQKHRVVRPVQVEREMRFIDRFAFFLLGFTIGATAIAVAELLG